MGRRTGGECNSLRRYHDRKMVVQNRNAMSKYIYIWMYAQLLSVYESETSRSVVCKTLYQLSGILLSNKKE